MRRTWPFVIAVAAVGGLAGVAIAGRPAPADTFAIDPSTVTTIDRSTDTIAIETLPPELTASPTTNDLQTTTTAATAATDPTDTVEAATTTTLDQGAASTSTAPDSTLDRADVRLVLANGDGRFNLAGANANRLRDAGYVTIDGTDITDLVDATVLYYRPAFDDEAAIVAADLGIPDALLQPLPDQPVTVDDALGDIVVVLGPDALR